jgi:hypothetical protein
VLIWRPAGISVVRNTNGREGSTPVYNRVLGPDLARLKEVGMDGKRVIGVDIGKRWLDVARETAAEVERHANQTATIAALVESFDPARDIVVFERCGRWCIRRGSRHSAKFRASRPRPTRSMHGCCRGSGAIV